MADKIVDSVIIGGGLLGCATAYYLARAGAGTVLLVERGRIGGEASAATAGGLGVQNKPPTLVSATHASLGIWSQLSQELGEDVGYRRSGGLNIACDETDFAQLQRVVARQQAAGANITLLSSGEACSLVPTLSRNIVGAAYCPDDSFAAPSVAAVAYGDAARRLGVEIWQEVEVRGLTRVYDHFLVNTMRGRVLAARLVNAAGAWTRAIAAMLQTSLPLTPMVGQRIILGGEGMDLPHLINHVRDNLSIKQDQSNAIMIGGGWLGKGNLTTRGKQTIPRNVTANLELAGCVLPQLAGRSPRSITLGWDAYTPDRLPLCGHLPGVPNAYVIHGSRRGYSLGPYLGQALATIIANDDIPDLARDFLPSRTHPPGVQIHTHLK